jgi:hypothetical protein
LNDIEFPEALNDIGKLDILKKSRILFLCNINGTKVDFVNYHYPWLEKPVIIDGVRMASVKDIAAMKLNAIAGRGSRKDFVDLYFLLKKFELDEMMKFFIKKYQDGSPFLVLKSLTWFEDAEKLQMPEMIKNVSWEEVKHCISEKTNIINKKY